jgi:hypothetical protein
MSLSFFHKMRSRAYRALIVQPLAAALRQAGASEKSVTSGQQAAMPEAKPAWGFVPPGHFYSPIPDWEEVKRRAPRLFGDPPRSLAGIDLREEAQLALAQELAGYYADQPFTPAPAHDRRYYFENPTYSYSDALILHGMIRHARPRRFIEVGSGYSSCVTLDTNDLFFGGRIACSFIEPYPEALHSLLRPGDSERVRIFAEPVQDVSLQVFQELEKDDILFIDSTHVSKVGSDLNALVFDVLPALKPGVYVHFHDLFYPFEYPRGWLVEGRAWNEAYLLRAFLSFNSDFEVVFWNDYQARYNQAWLEAHMPLCLRNTGGSLWLRRKR